jgi:hypothetical protein
VDQLEDSCRDSIDALFYPLMHSQGGGRSETRRGS